MNRFILIFILLPFFCYSQPSRYKKEIEWYKPSHKKKEQKILHDGKLTDWTAWYENGKLKFQKFYKNQKMNGVFKEWYETGNLKSFEHYRSDTIVDTAFYYYPTARMEYQKVYQNGDVVHEIHWLDNNLKDYEELFDKDKSIKTRVKYSYFKNNSPKSEEVFTNNIISKRVTWYESGKKWTESYYENGRLEGEANEYYESGKIKSKITYVNGTAKKIEKWNENGQKEKVRVVTDQKPDSTRTVKPVKH